MIWIKLVAALFALIFTMLIVGGVLSKKEDPLPEQIILGFFGLLGVMQLVAIPMIFMYLKFANLIAILFLVFVVAVVIVCFQTFKFKKTYFLPIKQIPGSLKTMTKKEKCLLLLLILVVVGQLGVVLLFTHADADDAFYVATAVDTIATDTMYRVDPHTGTQLNAFPVRYVLSPFPMFYAVVGKVFKVSPTIVAHILIPIIVLPMCYLVAYLLGLQWFHKNREKALFMTLIVGILMMFQGATSYATGSFLLLRSWQGKAILATVILPFIIYLYFKEDYDAPHFWAKIVILLLASANVSSMGIMLAPIAVVVLGFVSALLERRMKPLVGSFFCCIPSGIYALMYVKLYAWQLF